jgi:hypothetical protein
MTEKLNRPKLALVPGATPLTRPTAFEKQVLDEVRGWLEAVYENRPRERPYDPTVIMTNKTGRALVIDGDRGLGKTTILLTILKLLQDGELSKEEEKQTDPDRKPWIRWPHKRNTHCLLPVLDFDPLPPNIPVHGWLLSPWHSVIQRDGFPAAQRDALKDLWHELFDQAINGWTGVNVEGKALVEKTLAFDEQVMGWRNSPKLWANFINRLCCAMDGCTDPSCQTPHERLFVVPIDDVDLQVEHVVGLLHAIRLFHHPNVVYLMTADMGHIRFATALDYHRRHMRGLTPSFPSPESTPLGSRVREWSNHMAAALEEKGTPQHACVALRRISLQEVLEGLNVKDQHFNQLEKLNQLAGHVRFTTWRRAQHAWDRRIGSTHSAGRFLLDLCGARQDGDENPPKSSLSGTLTTTPGRLLKEWGAETRVLLFSRPSLEFRRPTAPLEVEPVADEHEATAALILAAAAMQDEKLVEAPNLDWGPDAGVLATRTKVGVPRGQSVDLWWPWVRPSVAAYLQLDAWTESLATKWDTIKSPNDLNLDNLVFPWVKRVLEWLEEKRGTGTIGDTLAARLRSLLGEPETGEGWQRREDARVDAKTFSEEMLLFVAPYYGLASSAREKFLRWARDDVGVQVSGRRLQDHEEKFLSTYLFDIAATQAGEFGNVGEELDNLVERFLERWRVSTKNDRWWTVRRYGAKSNVKSNGVKPKSIARRAKK